MKYVNANQVLPDCLIRELQEYVQGNYLYVPVREGERKNWGERSGCKAAIEERNRQITARYRAGATMEELAKSCHLSIHAIRKIIYSK